MDGHESLDPQQPAPRPEGPDLRKRLFESYVNELIGAASRYKMDSIAADELIADVKKILRQLETFCPGGEAENVLSRAQLVIAEKLCDDVFDDVGTEFAKSNRIDSIRSCAPSISTRDRGGEIADRLDSSDRPEDMESERTDQ